MEMRAKEEVEIGVDITPAIPPLTAALYGGYLHSHCSSCFSPLPTTFPLNSNSNDLLYCSPRCHHLSLSAELHLIQSLRSVSHPPPLPSSDLRATLRLLHFLSSCPAHATRHPHRIAGLLTNRDKFLSRIDEDDDPLSYRRIHEGAKLVAAARRREKGAEFFSDDDGDVLLEEAALCLVLTNAVELQDENSRNLGIAVYDWRFSWINHSCSPNACYRFSFLSSSSHNTASFCTTDDDDYSLLRIAPHSSCLQV